MQLEFDVHVFGMSGRMFHGSLSRGLDPVNLWANSVLYVSGGQTFIFINHSYNQWSYLIQPISYYLDNCLVEQLLLLEVIFIILYFFVHLPFCFSVLCD